MVGAGLAGFDFKKSSLHEKPLEISAGVQAHNLLGVSFLGVDVSTRLPLAGPLLNSKHTLSRAQNGGNVSWISNAEMFIGFDTDSPSQLNLRAGVTIGMAFARVAGRMQSMPSAGVVFGYGLADRLDLYFNARFYKAQSVFADPVQVRHTSYETNLSLHYDFYQRKPVSVGALARY